MPDPMNWSDALPLFGAVFLVAYLLGSIPFGLILTRMAGLGDIRKVGSGNIGATNVLRTGRKGLAALTLLLDLLKGLAAVWLAARYGPDSAVVAAWGAVVGHIFPVWLGFKGGKGGATMLGVGIGLDPELALYAALTWIAVAVSLRYSSLATLVAVGLAPVYAWLLGEPQIAEAIAILTVLIWARHHANIRRLLNGEESKIAARKEA